MTKLTHFRVTSQTLSERELRSWMQRGLAVEHTSVETFTFLFQDGTIWWCDYGDDAGDDLDVNKSCVVRVSTGDVFSVDIRVDGTDVVYQPGIDREGMLAVLRQVTKMPDTTPYKLLYNRIRPPLAPTLFLETLILTDHLQLIKAVVTSATTTETAFYCRVATDGAAFGPVTDRALVDELQDEVDNVHLYPVIVRNGDIQMSSCASMSFGVGMGGGSGTFSNTRPDMSRFLAPLPSLDLYGYVGGYVDHADWSFLDYVIHPSTVAPLGTWTWSRAPTTGYLVMNATVFGGEFLPKRVCHYASADDYVSFVK